MRVTEGTTSTGGTPICVRLGSLAGPFKAQCARQGVTVNEQIRVMIAQVLLKPESAVLKAPSETDRIRVSIGKLKSEFNVWCKSRGMGASAALRLLIAQTLEQQILSGQWTEEHEPNQNARDLSEGTLAGQAVLGDQEQAHEPSRMRLRLKPSELDAISQMAEQRRTTAQRLATQILRAFLLRAAVFSQQETVDMGAVNLSLMRIGTNLNQIAKQLNAHATRATQPDDEAKAKIQALDLEMRKCMTQLDDHVRACSQALALSRERWRIELRD